MSVCPDSLCLHIKNRETLPHARRFCLICFLKKHPGEDVNSCQGVRGMLRAGGAAAIVNPAGFSWQTGGRTAAGRGEPEPGQLEDMKHKSSGLNPPLSVVGQSADWSQPSPTRWLRCTPTS